MSIQANYKHYPLTIRLFSKTDESGKPKMVPVASWVKRDGKGQPVVPYTKNVTNGYDIGMVLERLFVIDIDVGHGNDIDGKQSFHNWIMEHSVEERNQILQDIADTMRVNTPSGGTHVYFIIPHDMDSYTGQRSVGAMEGVDLLTGKNSYTPAPNTQRADGKYKLHEKSGENIKEAPEWVVKLFEQASKRKNTAIADNEKTLMGSEGGLFNKYLTSMRKGFNSGTRNEMITKLSGKLARDLVKGSISKENALFVLEITGQNCNPPMDNEEIEASWNSVLKREKENEITYRKKRII